jgi:putative ABC transport system substrate-binding protein
MRRRDFITLLGGAAAAWPLAARAQQPQAVPKRALVGFLGASSSSAAGRYYQGFPQGMRERGYREGVDYQLVERYADGQVGRLPSLAHELVSVGADVIVASNSAAALATMQATSRIPIVVGIATDPVGLGLVGPEAHSGGNVTGILLRLEGLTGKQLEFALELVPGATRIGVLANPDNPSNVSQRRDAESAVEKLGLTPVVVEVKAADDIAPAFQMLARERADIVVVLIDAMFFTARRQIAAFALALHLPTVFGPREHVEDGGLMSYGINQLEGFRRAAYYVDRILKGDKPGDLPMEFPTKLDLVVNGATAKALGLTVPPKVLVFADEVIE